MEAVTVADTVAKEVVARFGVSRAIHSDQGKQLEGNYLEMCKVLNIKKTRRRPTIPNLMEWWSYSLAYIPPYSEHPH
jgi:hypothetical protein